MPPLAACWVSVHAPGGATEAAVRALCDSVRREVEERDGRTAAQGRLLEREGAGEAEEKGASAVLSSGHVCLIHAAQIAIALSRLRSASPLQRVPTADPQIVLARSVPQRPRPARPLSQEAQVLRRRLRRFPASNQWVGLPLDRERYGNEGPAWAKG